MRPRLHRRIVRCRRARGTHRRGASQARLVHRRRPSARCGRLRSARRTRRDPGPCAQGAVAVGECGLDYHYDHSPRPLQRRAFADQLAIARESARPVVVHTREAEDDTMAMVREARSAGIRGVLHCYTGSLALAEVALDAGWYLSFSGVVTFKKWDDDALLRMAPDARVLVETDAPYLAPVPHRGKRNEPAYASLTLARVAEARGVSAEALGDIVSANAVRFFGLASGDRRRIAARQPSLSQHPKRVAPPWPAPSTRSHPPPSTVS
ncbi:MAG: TatD family hydrolase [Gemmatimonadetes bacterium]|nr:TatD family hydrolase [Gemmatimonadota bacterium]